MNFSQYIMGLNEMTDPEDKVQNNNNFSDDPNVLAAEESCCKPEGCGKCELDDDIFDDDRYDYDDRFEKDDDEEYEEIEVEEPCDDDECEGCDDDECECCEEAVLREENDNSGFGEIKMSLPTGEGLANAIDDADQFANASDGQDTDIDLSINKAFPEDKSGFEKDAEPVIEPEEAEVDPNTIPAVNAEEDQFAPEGDEEQVVDEPTAAELADESDVEDSVVGESVNDWDDLF